MALPYLSYATPPRGATGWSVVCDCGISWSYSLTFVPSAIIVMPIIIIHSTCPYHYLAISILVLDYEWAYVYDVYLGMGWVNVE